MNQFKDKEDGFGMQDNLQAQVIDLQTSLAHLEVTVERLNDVITRQDKDIHTLQRQLQLIYKQIDSQSTEVGVAPFDVMADRPPHY
ncbi:SlyX family protein [Psychrobacter celer]|uniref:SlyX family protein n=1 Tax=Psychrobacter celer TaxID=306572 RepID=UPI003FD147DF